MAPPGPERRGTASVGQARSASPDVPMVSNLFRVAAAILLAWGASASAAVAQQTLIQGTVRAVTPGERASPETFTWAAGHTVIIERLETGERLPVNCDEHGAFEFR